MKDYNYDAIAQLVILSSKGDSNAFAELYTMTYNMVYQYTFRYLKEPFLAQDALQEIYIKALKNISTISEPGLFIAWLKQICFHVCYDMVKKRSGMEYSSPELLEIIEDSSFSSNPERVCQDSDEKKRLALAVGNLPFKEKEAVVLRYFRNLKLEEAAKIMDVSRSSFKRYLASAQEHLKSEMSGKEQITDV